jgi:hypothetical protein
MHRMTALAVVRVLNFKTMIVRFECGGLFGT